jgi:hypothetical protein
MSIKLKSLLILLIILMGGLVLPQQAVHASSGTTTSATALGYNFQRHTCNASDLTWYFYSDGTDMVWTSTSDYITNNPIHVCVAGVTSGNMFSIFSMGMDICYARVDGTGALFYRVGIGQTDGSINWLFSEKLITTTGYSGKTAPSICMDQLGYTWIGFCGISTDGGVHTTALVIRGVYDNFTVGTPMPIELERSYASVQYGVCLTPLTNGFVVATYGSDSTPLSIKTFNSNNGENGFPMGTILNTALQILQSIAFYSGYNDQTGICQVQVSSIESFTASSTRYNDGSGPAYGTFTIHYGDGTVFAITLPGDGDVLKAIYTYNLAHNLPNTEVITQVKYTTQHLFEHFSSSLLYYADGLAIHERYGGDSDYSAYSGTINLVKPLPPTWGGPTAINDWNWYAYMPGWGDVAYYNFTTPLNSTYVNNISVKIYVDTAPQSIDYIVRYSDGTSTTTPANFLTTGYKTTTVSFTTGKLVESFKIVNTLGGMGPFWWISSVLFNATSIENSFNNAVTDRGVSTDGTYAYISTHMIPMLIRKITLDGLAQTSTNIWQGNNTYIANNTLTYQSGFLYVGSEGYGDLPITKINATTMLTNATYTANLAYTLGDALAMCSNGTVLYVLTYDTSTNNFVVVRLRESNLSYIDRYTTGYFYEGIGHPSTIMYNSLNGNIYVCMSQTPDCFVLELDKDLGYLDNWDGGGYGAYIYSSTVSGSYIYIGTGSKIVKITAYPLTTAGSWTEPVYTDKLTSIVTDGTYLYVVYNTTTPVLAKISIDSMTTVNAILPSTGAGSCLLTLDYTGLFNTYFDKYNTTTTNFNYIVSYRTSVFDITHITADTIDTFSSFSCTANDTDVYLSYSTTPTISYSIMVSKYNGLLDSLTTFSALETIASVTVESPSISKNVSGDIIVFWKNYPLADTIYYSAYRASTHTWNLEVVAEISAGITSGTSLISVYESFSPTGIGWMTGPGPAYTIQMNGPLTGGEPTLNYLVISDLDAGISFFRNVYSMNKYYTFVASTTTPANPNDVTTVYITAIKGAQIYFKVRGDNLNTVPVWSVIYNSTIINLDTPNCVWAISGTTGTATFKIETKWNFTTTAGLDLYLEAQNPTGSSGIILMQSNYFDVISTLIGTIITTTPNVFLGVQEEIHGQICYEREPANTSIFTTYMVAPPDAEFNKVEVWNTTKVAQDWAIVNGTYSVIFIPYLVTGNQTYHLMLDLISPYVYGIPANNCTLTIYVTATWTPNLSVITGPLQSVFDLFGITGGVTAIWNMLAAFGGATNWFVSSITMIMIFVSSLAVAFFNFSVFLFGWVVIMVNFIRNIVAVGISLLDGTNAVLSNGSVMVVGGFTGLGNIWNLFGGTNLILFMPFIIFIVWLQSLDSRQETMGVGIISLAINDFQTAYGLINVLTGFAMFIYSIVSDWMRWIFGFLAGFFIRLFSAIP